MYVVTGVGGYVGAKAADLLLDEVAPDEVIVTSRSPEVLRRWADRGVQARQADYRDVELTTAAFQGGTRLFMVSAMEVGPERQRQHVNAVAAARAAGVQYIAYTSFLGADDPTNDAFVVHDHRRTEQEILSSGLSWNFLRNSQYGDAMANEQAVLAITTGSSTANFGEGAVGFVARDDVAAVGAALLLGRGEPDRGYDVTGPELLSQRQVTELIAEVSGVPIDVVDLDDEQMYAMWDAMGVPREATDDFSSSPVPWCSHDMVTFGAAIREGRLAVLSDTVPQLTGRPATPLRELMVRARPSWPAPAPVPTDR